MLKAKIYNQKGTDAGSIDLPEKVFGVKWKSDLVHQVVHGILGNKRAGTADSKGRGEVRGGGKKPWKQKGTGQARHGSTRSPIWVGGGVTHGPLAEKNYKRKISKKMRAGALFSVLSKKFKDGEIIFVDSLEMKDIKTKSAVEVMKNLTKATGIKDLSASKKPRVLVAISGKNEKMQKSFRNLPSLELALVNNINPMLVLNYKYLLIENPEAAVKFLATRADK
ncbi:MAG: 50S ribosomal protein L4 [Candidatus Nomurabacteria bacterium]|nr:50S ribosomal protein L4 [Candidatus Nomurabacteria bacterium]